MKRRAKISKNIFHNYLKRHNLFYLKRSLKQSNMNILATTYLSKTIFFSVLAFILSIIILLTIALSLKTPILFFIATPLISIIPAMSVFLLIYFYPEIRARTIALDINKNLPYMINHMSAISGSGMPPNKLFHLIAEQGKYGALSQQASLIVRDMEVLGYDFLTAVEHRASVTPSKEFKEFLYSLSSTIKSGGDIPGFLTSKTYEFKLDYKLRLKEFSEHLELFSMLYGSLFLGAPILFLALFSVISMFSASMELFNMLKYGILIIVPLFNCIFYLVIYLSEPGV